MCVILVCSGWQLHITYIACRSIIIYREIRDQGGCSPSSWHLICGTAGRNLAGSHRNKLETGEIAWDCSKTDAMVMTSIKPLWFNWPFHVSVLKTGASGMIAYRLLCKDLSFQYVQTSSRLVYKNSKPDFIVSTHRPLTEEEGKDLLSKRTMDFKVSYLDAGLSTQYFETGEPANSGTNGPKLNPR